MSKLIPIPHKPILTSPPHPPTSTHPSLCSSHTSKPNSWRPCAPLALFFAATLRFVPGYPPSLHLHLFSIFISQLRRFPWGSSGPSATLRSCSAQASAALLSGIWFHQETLVFFRMGLLCCRQILPHLSYKGHPSEQRCLLFTFWSLAFSRVSHSGGRYVHPEGQPAGSSMLNDLFSLLKFSLFLIFIFFWFLDCAKIHIT